MKKALLAFAVASALVLGGASQSFAATTHSHNVKAASVSTTDTKHAGAKAEAKKAAKKAEKKAAKKAARKAAKKAAKATN